MSHVTNFFICAAMHSNETWVMSYDTCHDHHTYKWVMSRIWLFHLCCDAFKWNIFHVPNISHIDESCHELDSFICAAMHAMKHQSCHITVSTENASPPKPTKSRNSDSSVSRGTNSNWDLDFIWICTEEFEFLDLVGLESVPFLVKTLIRDITVLMRTSYLTHTHTHTHTLSLSHTIGRTRMRLIHIYRDAFQWNSTAFIRYMTHSYCFWIWWIWRV